MKRHLEFLAIAVLASVPVLTKLDFDSRSPLPQHEPPCANFACGTLGLSSLDGLDGNGNHCAPDPNQPLSRVTVFSNIEEKRNIPDGTVDLACDFDSSQYSHFPHSMQQLYGCFSNWRDFPELQPVLLLSSNLEAKLKRNHFLNGFLQLMESQLKLQIRNESYHEEQSKHVKSYLIEAVNRSGYMLRHSSDLNHFAEQEFQLSSADVGHACKNEKPRFGILNRSVKSQRSIVNAEMIASIDAVKRLSWNNTVAVKYFEGETFAEQMDFFRSVDILLTPHGAQLTGLPFMNAPCSHVVELFPKVRNISLVTTLMMSPCEHH